MKEVVRALAVTGLLTLLLSLESVMHTTLPYSLCALYRAILLCWILPCTLAYQDRSGILSSRRIKHRLSRVLQICIGSNHITGCNEGPSNLFLAL